MILGFNTARLYNYRNVTLGEKRIEAEEKPCSRSESPVSR